MEPSILRKYLKIAFALSVCYVIYFLSFAAYINTMGVVVFLASVCAIYPLNERGCSLLGARLLSVSIFAIASYCITFTGGAYSPLVIWLLPITIMTAFLLGIRAGIYLSIAASIWLAALLAVDGELLSKWNEFSQDTPLRLLTLLAYTSALSTNMFFAFIAISKHQRINKSLQENQKAMEQVDLEKNKLLRDLDRQVESLNISALVSETDHRGIITYANGKFAEISGYSVEELVGKPHKIVNSKHHPKEFWKNYWETISRGEIWKGDICNRAKDGSLYWVAATVFPKRGLNGEIEGYAAVRINITEKQRIKAELEKSIQKSKELVAAKTTFLANMTHELRTPLNAIIGYSQMLIEDNETGDFDQKTAIEDICRIASSGKHLLHLVNDVLDFSKMESQGLKVTVDNISLEHLVEQLEAIINPLAKKKGNQLVVNLEYGLKFFQSDRSRVQQILINLLSNAAKFSENSNIYLTISPGIGLQRNDVHFEVKDEGIGIAPENLDKIFSKFEQVHDTSKDPLAGSGLGLSITKSLVQNLEGDIRVESTLGEGTCFTVLLPNLKVEPPKLRGADNKPNLLILDDDEDICQYMTSILEEQFQCFEATNKHEALTLMELNKFDIMLIDFHMPDVSGLEFVDIIRKRGFAPERIFLITGTEETRLLERARNANFEAIIQKPFTEQELLSLLSPGPKEKKVRSFL